MIRPAVATDVAAIRTLWNLAIRETLITFNSVEKTVEEAAALLADSDACFVAERDGAVLGYASYGAFRSGVGYAHTREHSIMLAPEARSAGLGRALMAAIETHASAAGVHSLIAGISGSNPMGVPFHAALGFAHVGRIPQAGRKFDAWHDLILMQKIL